MPLAFALEAFFAFMVTQIIGSPVFFVGVKCAHCFPQLG